PPPAVVVVYPFDFSQLRKATSCVLPSCGAASFLPLRSATLVIDGFTTRKAPPDVAPEMMRIACPCDLMYALIAGFGPMDAASSAPANSAVTSSGPAVYVLVFKVTFEPRSFWKMPWSTPTIADACVRFGK